MRDLKQRHKDSKEKIFQSSIIYFSQFEDDKHIGGIPFAKWNPLTPRSTISVVDIGVNTYFFSLIFKFSNDLFLLSNQALRNKKNKNFWIKNDFLKKFRN